MQARKDTRTLLPDSELSFDADGWEKGCEDDYYAAEARCNEEHEKCIEAGTGIAECERRLKQCLSRAESDVDECIEDGRLL